MYPLLLFFYSLQEIHKKLRGFLSFFLIGEGKAIKLALCGAIAQLGERYNGIVEVRGSIPLGSTK
jgi:hypothetical protein